MRLLVVAIAIVVGSTVAEAHPLDIGYLRLDTKGTSVDVALDINREATAMLLGVPESSLDEKTLAARGAELAAITMARAPITTPNGPCTWAGATARFEGPKSVRISDTASCPAGERRWQFPFVREGKISGTFELLVKEAVGGEERVKLVDRYEPEYVLGTASYSFLDFVWSGVEHIGVAPNQWHDDDGPKLPDGIDHILFLIALMLGGGTLWRLVGIATGFTLGHSITLALATTGVLRLPGSIIEPIIALSIALAAAEAATNKFERYRWMIASGFGLVHGFGFAAALVQLDLAPGDMAKALFGYNLGVEVGQVGLVLVVAPLVLLAHRSEVMKKYVLRAIAASIFIAGMYWFVQRAFMG
jgi:hypothetical protein